MIHRHHRKRRPHCTTEEYDHPANILPLVEFIHELVHKNPLQAYQYGLLIRSWMSLDEAPAPDIEGFLAALGRTPVGTGVQGEGVEKQCPKCHGKGKIVEQEKAKPEPGPARNKVTWSVRVPKDERENGYEVIDSLVDGSVDLLADAGLIRDRNKGANYYTLVYALAFFQQNFKAGEE